MKNYLMFAVSLLLICTSCQKEDEILPGQYFSGNPLSDSSADLKGIMLRSECFDLATDVWVNGTAKLKSPQTNVAEKSSMATAGSRGIKTYYVIQADGAGWSDQLARCLTNVQLNYWPDSKKVTGTITSVFANGEELYQQIDGIAVSDQHETGALTIDLSTALLQTGKDSFNLDQGQLNIQLPGLLSGRIEITFSTHGMYCETEAP